MVRLNFALAPWTSPPDDTQHDGRTWLQAYRAIVDGLRDQGVRIYGLISHEAVAAELGDDLRNPPPEDHARSAVAARLCRRLRRNRPALP